MTPLKRLLLPFFILFGPLLFGQIHWYNIQEDCMYDAIINSNEPNKNFKDHSDFTALAWTNSGNLAILRSYLYFNLETLPPNAELVEVYLNLYSYFSSANSTHSTLSGSNASRFYRITQSWNDSTITWNTQPAYDPGTSVYLPRTTAEFQDYLNIDLTPLVKDMQETENHGIVLRLVTEEIYRKMLFASLDQSNTDLHPKVTLALKLPDGIDSTQIGSCFQYQKTTYPYESLIFPSVITPNGDGLGDVFTILNPQELGSFELQVFDAAGKLVYQTRDAHFKWTVHALASAVYYFSYSFIDRDGIQRQGIDKFIVTQ